MPILSSADFNAVRLALDVSLTGTAGTDALPDATIALAIYEPRAELLILKRDPLALTRTGTAGQHIKNATVFLTAALLAPAIPAVTKVAAGGSDVTFKVDWEARAAALLAAADDELDAILSAGTEDTADRPVAFTLASGGRSWRPVAAMP